jgi:hypothetical protein
VWIKFPGVSVGSSAPWPFMGSSNQFNVIVEPIGVAHSNSDGLGCIRRVDNRE